MDLATKNALAALAAMMQENGMIYKLLLVFIFIFVYLCYRIGTD